MACLMPRRLTQDFLWGVALAVSWPGPARTASTQFRVWPARIYPTHPVIHLVRVIPTYGM